MATTALSGNAIFESRFPAARESAASVYSTISASISPSAVISSVAAGSAGGGSAKPSLRATMGRVEPCAVAEISTTKKTTLKISGALGSPKINGKMAKIIGTEPRRPTQETSAISLRLKPNSAKIGITAMGRATNTRTKAITRPSSQTSSSAAGSISRPSTTNIVIWLSQARPS